MKRSYALVAIVILLCVGSLESNAFCGDPTYRSNNTTFVVGGTRWVLHGGVVYRNTISTEAVTCSQRNPWVQSGSHVSFAPIDRTTFPTLLRFTSRTTPLVAGTIMRILLDERNRLWSFNGAGDASMFDGVSWETFPHRTGTSLEPSIYGFDTGLDVIMKEAVIRIATPSYVDEIDVRPLVRRRLLEINGRLESPRFLGMDNILSNGYKNVISIDLASNTIDIDSKGARIDCASAYNFEALILDVRGNASPIEIRRSYHNVDEHERRRQALHQQYPFNVAPFSIHSTLHSLNVPVRDSVHPCGWTPERTGAYLDMVADANGTIYLAGFYGITVIPMSLEDRTSYVNESSITSATVYPNPASHHMTIELPVAPAKGTTAMIVDASGNTMYATLLENPSTLVDLTAFPTGMYTVVLSTERKRAARSLIVQR